ncbi:MAG: VCBS repeat-containing protein [Sphingobacterium sp.]|jgi:hypothetical protein|nr:VCBS repeat-containing protein [Sphingobacterium sp.]
MKKIVTVLTLVPVLAWAQQSTDQIRSTGFPVFPKIVNQQVAGSPILGQPTLINGTTQEIRVEKHGLAYPAFYDWNSDGKLDLLVGEFETGQTGSDIKVYLNEGTAKKPKYSGKYFYAKTNSGDTISNHQWCCIGIHPRFVDIDGDGKLDMLSGQYFPGLISLWRGESKGLGKREFVEQEGYVDKKKLRSFDRDDTDPENHLYWNYTAASFADFNGDGLLDLFVGGGKNLRVALNIGTKEKPK